MPFLRFSRDKRGYEHTYLVQATNRRGKPIRPRILYWYRTPPGVRLGRLPFDAEMRKTLEAQNPGIVFDWNALASTPFPAQEPEYWRERRRAERAAKQARREEEESESDEQPEAVDQAAADSGVSEKASGVSQAADDTDGSSVAPVGESEPVAAIVLDGPVVGRNRSPDGAVVGGTDVRKRRRRGGRRRRARPEDAARDATASGAPGTDGEPTAQDDSSSEEPE